MQWMRQMRTDMPPKRTRIENWIYWSRGQNYRGN